MARIKSMALFEPWGLGDLAIALSRLRFIKSQGCSLIVLCDPKWAEWVESLDWVSAAVPIHIPWTEKRKKYDPLRYSLKELLAFRKRLAAFEPDILCEVRGDVRNEIFLRLLGLAPVLSFRGETFRNRYDRSIELAKRIGYQASVDRPVGKGGMGVVCFFGAAWPNRQVPLIKGREIILGLLESAPYTITLVLQPGNDLGDWDDIVEKYQDRFIAVKAGILEVCNQIALSDLVISADTAWLHIAYLQGRATIGLFGFDNAVEWSPPGCNVIQPSGVLPASARYMRRHAETQPLASLDSSKIVSAVKDILR